MNTRALPDNRLFDHKNYEICSIQSLITAKTIVKQSKRNSKTGFQPQTQTAFITTNPILNNTETTESLPLTEVIEVSASTSSTLI